MSTWRTQGTWLLGALIVGCTSREPRPIVVPADADDGGRFDGASDVGLWDAVDSHDRGPPAVTDAPDARAGTDALVVADAPAPPPCTFVPRGSIDAPGTTAVRAEVVVTGLDTPWSLAFLPGGDLLVAERPGRVRRVHEGVLVAAPVLSVAAVEDCGNIGEGGLLGLAAHPDFSTSRLFYVFYTESVSGAGRQRIERYRLSDDSNSARLDRVILEGIGGACYHDGGRLRFGPDGMLYASVGDAGGDPQSDEGFGGKILRLDPEGGIPADNPNPARPWWIRGLRNSQGFDWIDRNTMVVVDHGPTTRDSYNGSDEFNVARRGANLGWPALLQCQLVEGFTRPALTWGDAHPPGGVARYTGDAIPGWRGSYLVTMLGRAELHRVVLDPDDPQRLLRDEVYFRGAFGRLREVIMGPDGHLYLTTSNCDGRGACTPEGDRVLRVVRAE